MTCCLLRLWGQLHSLSFATDFINKFSGTLLGLYATSNGGVGATESYISRWRYEGKGQKINNGTFVPYTPFTAST